MLNQTQNLQFCNSTSEWNCGDYGDEISWVCEPEDVVATQETVKDFEHGLANRCADEIVKTKDGDLHVWNNIQRKKGCRRGDLFVLDLGNARASYFSGE